MKVLLISDVHSNIDALEQVLSRVSYDDILFIGDVVDYGPYPFEVHSRLEQVKARRVLGNHDAAAAFQIDCRSSPQLYDASVLTREKITMKLMPAGALRSLGEAERRLDLDCGGIRVRTIHASPRDELYQYVTKDEAGQLEVKDADLLVLGHTHRPYEVKNDRAWVVNPGSVGMPKDGDPRASYAVLDTQTRQVTFGRCDYDPGPMLSRLKQLIGQETGILERLAGVFRNGR